MVNFGECFEDTDAVAWTVNGFDEDGVWAWSAETGEFRWFPEWYFREGIRCQFCTEGDWDIDIEIGYQGKCPHCGVEDATILQTVLMREVP